MIALQTELLVWPDHCSVLVPGEGGSCCESVEVPAPQVCTAEREREREGERERERGEERGEEREEREKAWS